MGNEQQPQQTEQDCDEFPDIYLDSDNEQDEAIDPQFEALLDNISSEIDSDYENEEDYKSKPVENNMPSFVTKVDGSIADNYTLDRQLGRGVSGNVLLVNNKYTKQQFALKQMSKTNLNRNSFLRETTILKAMNHPNIVSFDGAYISKKYFGITTSYCSGGTLLERVMLSPISNYTQKRFEFRSLK